MFSPIAEEVRVPLRIDRLRRESVVRETWWIFSTSKTEDLEPSRVQELCESRGGRPGLPVLMSFVVSVDVKEH